MTYFTPLALIRIRSTLDSVGFNKLSYQVSTLSTTPESIQELQHPGSISEPPRLQETIRKLSGIEGVQPGDLLQVVIIHKKLTIPHL